jgi:hypothetical protein
MSLHIKKWERPILFWCFIGIAMTIAILSKMYLQNCGIFAKIHNPHINTCSMVFLQFIKACANFDLVVLLICAFYLDKKRILASINCVFILWLGVTLYYSFLSTSRMQLTVVALIVCYIFWQFFLRRKALLLIGAIGMFVSFRVLSAYRSLADTNVFAGGIKYFDAIILVFKNLPSPLAYISMIADTFMSRLNYIDFLARAIDITIMRETLRFDYYMNIIGLIPRIIWRSKPIIGLDWHKIGQELYILSYWDEKSTVALGVIGESFYELQYLGIIVAVFHGMLFWLINRIFKRPMHVASYVIYPLLSIYIVSRDGFMGVLPGIVYTIFPALFILWVLNGYEHTQAAS